MAEAPSFKLPDNLRVLGRHVHLDLYDCPEALLARPADSERILLAAAAAMGATVIGAHFHAFNPHGVSGVVIIAESHLTVHTWPEHGYAAVDVFSCGELDLDAGMAVLETDYQAGRKEVRAFDRGWVKEH
jgi:S-adenosylmethionine decarboxylase proenzyme